jgi:hypothetical protein
MIAIAETGDILFDMNDYHGRDNLINSGSRGFGMFRVVPGSVQVIRLEKSSEIVSRILLQAGVEGPYMNKSLVALNDGGYGQDIQVIYSYDNVRFGLMTLEAVEEGDHDDRTSIP